MMLKMKAMAVLVLTMAGAAFAQDKFEDVSHKDLAAAVKMGKVALIDCNNNLTYNKNHIPGALNFNKVKAELGKLLPADKSTLVVAYCGDPDCSAYKSGANAALELGYTNVKFYSGGIVGWMKEKEKVEGTAAQ